MSDQKYVVHDDERDRCLAMFRNPLTWPMFPILPVKRRSRDGSMELGTVNATDPLRVVIGDTILGPQETFATPRDMLDGGWVVD